jgi:anti-sigma28 factor (negative regulator of flagellin synthesis)
MKVHHDQQLTAGSSAALGWTSGTDKTERAARYDIAGATASGQDQVEISSLIQRLAETSNAIISARGARVIELAKTYQAGRYVVDPQRISQRLISDSLPLAPTTMKDGNDR